MIKIWGKTQCPFCDIMKKMLDETGYTYYTVNCKENDDALKFVKDRGHRTVPQLYVDDIHINKKANTTDYTSKELGELITQALEGSWPWQDSGIEGQL